MSTATDIAASLPAELAGISGQKAEKPLRIAILSYRSTPHVGGQGIYIDYLSRALLERGHSVDVLSGPPYPECDRRVNIVKIPSLDLYAQPHNGHFALRPKHLLSAADTSEYFSHLSGRFSEPLTFSSRVARHFRNHDVDYDVILDNQSLGQGLLNPTVRKTPFVGVIHHPITRDLRLALEAEDNWKKRWLVRRWYSFHKEQIRVARRLPFLITPSRATKADIISEFGIRPEQLHVIPLGVDQDTFRPDPAVQRKQSEIITTASADVPLKGLIYLLRALAQVRKVHPEVSLRVIGKLRKGPTANELKKLGLEDAVTFESNLSRADLARAFCSASVSVSPSLYEGFGLPCAEAMSCATPVITSDGGALPEVAGDAGIIVPKADDVALAQALSEFFSLSADDRAAMGQKAYQRAVSHFNWASIAPLYEAVFQEAIASQC